MGATAPHPGDGVIPEDKSATVAPFGSAGRWHIERRGGDVSALHAVDPPGAASAVVMVMAPTSRALVLGSRQDPAIVDADAARRAGVGIVRRRSGGGAVMVSPDDSVWVDVWLPRRDRCWVDDVGVATHWLGQVWAEVARSFGLDATVHTGAMRTDEVASAVCFAGVGPGEVLVDGRKLVGISQRRTRDWARFQCLWTTTWDQTVLLELLGLHEPAVVERVRSCGFAAGVDAALVVERFLATVARR